MSTLGLLKVKRYGPFQTREYAEAIRLGHEKSFKGLYTYRLIWLEGDGWTVEAHLKDTND